MTPLGKLRSLLFLSALALHISFGHAAEIRDSSFSVEKWKGWAFNNDQTGEFSHCLAVVDYGNGTSVIVSQNRDQIWQIGFLNPRWSLPVHDNKSVFLKFDDSNWSERIGFVFDANNIILDMGIPGLGFSNLFRKSHRMQIRFDDLSYDFDLSNTSKLLMRISRCVSEFTPQFEVPRNNAQKTNGDDLSTADQIDQPQPSSESPSPPNPATPPNSALALPPDEIPSPEPSIGTGTGIIITTNGHILTNNHVVKGCTSIAYTREGELGTAAAVLRSDELNDLAVLVSDRKYTRSDVAFFRSREGLRAGDEIVVYGFPLITYLSQSGNIVSGNISSLAGLGDDARLYQITAPVQPGNSGGPLLDYSANLVGVVNAQLNALAVAKTDGSIPQNVNFAIKSNIAINFLDTHGVDYYVAESVAPFKLADVAERAKRFTVNIICLRE
jgi:S1-C subfamily serine protease